MRTHIFKRGRFRKKEKTRKGETIINDGGAQMIIILTIKEMSYVVVSLFDDLVGPLSHLCL